jgi:antitoxin StbD
MNASFKPPVIFDVHQQATVSISSLKSNPAAVVAEAKVRAVAVLNRNKAVAYVVSPEVWDFVNDALADRRLVRDAHDALTDDGDDVVINLDTYL